MAAPQYSQLPWSPTPPSGGWGTLTPGSPNWNNYQDQILNTIHPAISGGGPQPVSSSPVSAPLKPTFTGGPSAILGVIGSYSSAQPGTGAYAGSGAPLPTQPVYGYNPAYGGVPSVPNPVGTAGQSIGGNLGNLGQLGQLASGVTGINAGVGSLPYQLNLPNYQNLLGQASANTLSNLQGIIPADVIQQIQQGAAERGVAIGSPGSPNANSAMLRALGLTSLGLQQTGANQLAQLIGQTPTGPQFNPASQFVSPAQQQAAQMASNIFGAAPIPAQAQAAAEAAFGRGLNQGRGATAPTQAAQIANQIAQQYVPSGGTPSPGATPLPQGNWVQQEDGTWVNLDTGEVSWTGPGEESLGPNYYPGVVQSSQPGDQVDQSASYADVVYPPELYGGDGG